MCRLYREVTSKGKMKRSVRQRSVDSLYILIVNNLYFYRVIFKSVQWPRIHLHTLHARHVYNYTPVLRATLV